MVLALSANNKSDLLMSAEGLAGGTDPTEALRDVMLWGLPDRTQTSRRARPSAAPVHSRSWAPAPPRPQPAVWGTIVVAAAVVRSSRSLVSLASSVTVPSASRMKTPLLAVYHGRCCNSSLKCVCVCQNNLTKMVCFSYEENNNRRYHAKNYPREYLFGDW